jgi:hypothetical protein
MKRANNEKFHFDCEKFDFLFVWSQRSAPVRNQHPHDLVDIWMTALKAYIEIYGFYEGSSSWLLVYVLGQNVVLKGWATLSDS